MTNLTEKFKKEGKPIRVIALFAIIIVFIIVIVMRKSPPRQEKSVFDADPSISYAHGTFIWEDGISEPDIEYLLDVQNHYILKYQENLSRYGTDEENKKKKPYTIWFLMIFWQMDYILIGSSTRLETKDYPQTLLQIMP